jgi:YD repeat-containing protein
VVGIGTGSGPSQLACGHDFYVAGALLAQDDPEAPGVSASGMPGGWISDTTPSFTLTANGYDPGLGVRKTTFTREGSPNSFERPVGCNGAAGSRCPEHRTEHFNVSALSFDEGKNNAYMTVEDATGEKSTQTWQTYVDMTKPDVVLNGQLAVATDEDKGGQQGDEKVEELSLPVYNLEIKATDIGTEANADKKKRSGVRKLEVKLDGVKKEAWEQPCSDSCWMERTYALKLNNLSAGEHVLEVLATDGVEKVRERTIEFEYIPATGMKDEYVMQYFPLPDGSGNEAEEENPDRPELAVNVINGNLVYREKDVDVEGYGVNLEVERYYNSLLPEAENTEWGDGWTLAQTPDLQPEEGPGAPDEAMMVRSSGAVEGAIELPVTVNEEVFDPELQAVVTKEADGGFAVADATGETDTAIAFDQSGTVEELRTEGAASVDYDYDAGELAEIEVSDPASTDIAPGEAAVLAELESTPRTFNYAFGLQGSADGQFKVATDVAIDPTDSTVWVADDENDRIQHFTAEGAYIGKFASCADPGAVDVDLKGDIYVACSSANRIQKYDAKGTAVKTIAGYGTGNGQVRFPLDLALDPEGNLYVADTENARVQKFNAAGAFVKAIPVGESGRPWGVDVAPDGSIWSAEPSQSRVSVFDPQGSLLFRFGSEGTGPGQFKWAADVEVDEGGYAYVTDAVNNRVQVFDPKGAYATQFGEKGTGNGQLNTDWWLRVAVGSSGDVWVTDQGNSRLHKWKAAGRLRPGYGAGIQDDPEVEIETPGGLVASVEGKEAGEHVYEHEGDLLTSHEDEDGETTYEYDGLGRLTRVDLPNGTWAKVEYGSTDGRVKKVTVAPGGTGEQSTLFTYSDKPRRTVVTLPSAPVVTYDIGEDGSVLKWRNALKPPEFEVVAGTFYDVANKETAAPINAGDYNLSVKAYSEEGIAKIEMYANGNQVISESTCPPVYTEPAKCKKLPDEWATNTRDLSPGILSIEMVIEDRIGQVASRRFWVNIPYTPPPPSGQPVTPKFGEVRNFRDEHGLDLDLDPIQDEFELNDRVFDTINDWIQGNPVAKASMERWGAPLRTPEVAELEYRLAYWRQASEVIPAWAGSNAAGTFAGFYLDERAGGTIVVGFTGGQAAASLSALEQTAGLMAGADRIVAMTPPPVHTLTYLEGLRQQVSEAAAGYPSGLVTRTTVDVRSNSVKVGASNVAQAQSLLDGSFGQQAPITVNYQPRAPELKVGRERVGGMVRAGDEILPSVCTASFGAFDKSKKPGSGEPVLRLFALTAGHCVELGERIWRRSNPNPTEDGKQDIGFVRRSGYETEGPAIDVDAAAIRLDSPNFVPRRIFQAEGMPLIDVTSVWSPPAGTNLCFSGRTSKNIIRCGPILRPPEIYQQGSDKELIVCFEEYIWGGDSGSPVWVEGTGVAVGIAVLGYGGPDEPDLTPEQRAEAAGDPKEACAALLIPYSGHNPVATVFGSPDLAPLHLVTHSNAKP